MRSREYVRRIRFVFYSKGSLILVIETKKIFKLTLLVSETVSEAILFVLDGIDHVQKREITNVRLDVGDRAGGVVKRLHRFTK